SPRVSSQRLAVRASRPKKAPISFQVSRRFPGRGLSLSALISRRVPICPQVSIAARRLHDDYSPGAGDDLSEIVLRGKGFGVSCATRPQSHAPAKEIRRVTPKGDSLMNATERKVDARKGMGLDRGGFLTA